jgi:hypothetical protein
MTSNRPWGTRPSILLEYAAKTGQNSSDSQHHFAYAQVLWESCKASDTNRTAYIVPGFPCENGFTESFNSRFRDEFLHIELFTIAPETKLFADRWRWE